MRSPFASSIGHRWVWRLRFAVMIPAALVSPVVAGTEDSADRGISVSAWASEALDFSVTTIGGDHAMRDTTPILGVTGLGNIGRVAIGAAADGTPSIDGGRRLSMSALFGYQPRSRDSRLQALGEVGGRLFSDVGGSSTARQLGSDTWLPFAGVRLGATGAPSDRSRFELGLWIFCRHELGHAVVTSMSGVAGNETRTDYRLGGFTAGFAFQMGARFDRSPH